MVVSFRVFKKTSPNGRLTLYLGRRDFIDHVTESDPVDGVLLIDKDYLQGKQVRLMFKNQNSIWVKIQQNDNVRFIKKVFVQLVCSFRYGREDDETMGLSFKKELTLADEQVYPPTTSFSKNGTTRLQERLMTKLGATSYPFQLHFPRHSPTSVNLLPSEEEVVSFYAC